MPSAFISFVQLQINRTEAQRAEMGMAQEMAHTTMKQKTVLRMEMMMMKMRTSMKERAYQAMKEMKATWLQLSSGELCYKIQNGCFQKISTPLPRTAFVEILARGGGWL